MRSGSRYAVGESRTRSSRRFIVLGWGYKGAIGEQLRERRPGRRHRRRCARSQPVRLFVGIRDPRLVLGGEFDVAQRRRRGRTRASPRTTRRRPRATCCPSSRSCVRSPSPSERQVAASALSLRYDPVTPAASTRAFVRPATRPDHTITRTTSSSAECCTISTRGRRFALDYQEALTASNSVSAYSTGATSKTYFAHSS